MNSDDELGESSGDDNDIFSSDDELYNPDLFDEMDEINKRAGHIVVPYENGAIVWAGYSELPEYLQGHEYYLPSEIWHYSYLNNKWKKLITKGDFPNRCSGAGGCVLDDNFYVAAGFHRIIDEPEDLDDFAWEEIDRIEISNSLWSLNLRTLVWTKIEPGGLLPLSCDKTCLWAYDKKVYMFGGFGPPPSDDYVKVDNLFQYAPDEDAEVYMRGWSNQLLYYNKEDNKWVWPSFSGNAPSPRACHSAALVRDKVYIFGGRHGAYRLNDLYCLDMRSHTWTNILMPSDAPPIGRSWQTLTAVHTENAESYLILYGGFDNNKNALGDCWKLEVDAESPEWKRMEHLEQGPRLWHSSALINQNCIVVVGGLTNNILAPNNIRKLHAEKVLYLNVGPKSLLVHALEFISDHKEKYGEGIKELPSNLRTILENRCGGG
eukprot:TRINITY_DN11392_c0_g2_i1.p1 TRINITY_DN11392_c0_g2~~TRINITY_DN11392_c0_g2_i1.p1  ORF type:complete len:433 (+),score=52.91 TRINITY_DN11392_c0_g2_i1:56-1354(+)